VNIRVEPEYRLSVLETVLAYESGDKAFINPAMAKNIEIKSKLENARQLYSRVIIPNDIKQSCIDLAEEFQVEGHRADYIMALAAKACAAREGSQNVSHKHLHQVAPLALHHRRPEFMQNSQLLWSEIDNDKLNNVLNL